jgi:hypothetical protein
MGHSNDWIVANWNNWAIPHCEVVVEGWQMPMD